MLKVADKYVVFDLHKAKETFMDVKNSFAVSGASTLKAQSTQTENPEEVIGVEETDPLMLTSFLQNCMKFLRYQK